MDLEFPSHERMDRTVVIAVGGPDEPPSPSRVEIMLPHQPPHLLGVDEEAAVTELGIDAAVAIALERVGDGPDLRDDLLVPALALGFGVETGARDAHQFAPPPDREAVGPTVTDVGAPFRQGPERMPLLKNSISSA
jgi:hypothetical protein